MNAVIVSSNTFEDLPSEPVSRAEGIENRQRAIENGHRFYVGPACKHGHGGRRYTKRKDRKGRKAQTGDCVECVRKHQRAPEYKAHKREYNQRRREERAELSEDGGLTFLGSPCGKCGGARRYVRDGRCVSCNQEYKQRCAEECSKLSEDGGITFHGAPCGKCGGTRYYVSNGKCVSCQAVATHGHRAQTDSQEDTWDTADWLKVSALHEEARALSRRTGVAHEVDHIAPLAKGGAHHPDNMQIIFARENRAKGAKAWAEEDHLAWLLGG